MWLAALWGGVAGSAVFLGALFGIFIKIRKNIIGYIMSFGTGVLIGAATFELLDDSVKHGGVKFTVVGFILGAFIFTSFDLFIASRGGKERKRSKQNPTGHSGLAIFIGTIMDAIPESIVIGVSLLEEGISWLLIIAIFISNFPEGLSSSIGLKQDGYTNKKVLLLWFIVLILSSVSSLLGFVFLKEASEAVISIIGAFAAGGIIAMVSSTMMPEAYEEGGPVVGFIASIGLISSLVLSNIYH